VRRLLQRHDHFNFLRLALRGKKDWSRRSPDTHFASRRFHLQQLFIFNIICMLEHRVHATSTYRATTKNWSICFSVSELLGSKIFSSSFSKSRPSSSSARTQNTHTHTHSYVDSLWTTHVQQEFLHYSWFSFTFLVCDSRVQSLNEALSWRRSLWRCQPPELQHMEQNVINMALIRGLAIPVVRNCNLSFSFLLRIQLWQKNNWSS